MEGRATHDMPNVPGVLVTAVSSNHFREVLGLVHSAQAFLPRRWKIVVYDLIGDLSAADVRSISSWCGVEYRRFDSRRVNTWDERYLTVSVWKPAMIRDCLTELPPNGVVIYSDASTRLHQPLSTNLLDAVRRVGFVGRQTASPVSMYTHPQMPMELALARQFAVLQRR